MSMQPSDMQPSDMQPRVEQPRAQRRASEQRDSSCPRCGHDEVLIGLNVDGARLVMHACATCDTRRWQRDGDVVELDGVLHDLSNVPTRYRRSLSG
jgi:hypothetical protein